MDQHRNDSKSHIYYSFFENIILDIHIFYISPNVLVDIIRAFFYSRFSSRKSESQRKLVKKITHISIQLRSKNLTYFMNFNSLDIENNMFPKAKSLSHFTNFSVDMFLYSVKKQHLHCTISEAL